MGQYTYTSSNGSIKVKNATGYFDKKKEQVIMTCEAQCSSATDASALFSIYRGSTRETFGGFVLPDNKWHQLKVIHNISEDDTVSPTYALIDHGAVTFSLIVHDNIIPANGEYVSVDIVMDIDLAPVEHHLTFLNDNFGSDSTPDILFSLTDLGQETFMNVPTLTVTSSGSTANTLTATFGAFDIVIGTGGIVNMNGIAMGDSSVAFTTDNSHPGNKTYFKRIDSYKITSPTMVEGLNDFTIDLKCEVI